MCFSGEFQNDFDILNQKIEFQWLNFLIDNFFIVQDRRLKLMKEK